MTSCVAIAQLSTGRKTFKQATSAADGYVRARARRVRAGDRRVRASMAWLQEHLGGD